MFEDEDEDKEGVIWLGKGSAILGGHEKIEGEGGCSVREWVWVWGDRDILESKVRGLVPTQGVFQGVEVCEISVFST